LVGGSSGARDDTAALEAEITSSLLVGERGPIERVRLRRLRLGVYRDVFTVAGGAPTGWRCSLVLRCLARVRKAKTRKALHDLPLEIVIGHRLILTRRADFSTLNPYSQH
jgi:hypothetical protein